MRISFCNGTGFLKGTLHRGIYKYAFACYQPLKQHQHQIETIRPFIEVQSASGFWALFLGMGQLLCISSEPRYLVDPSGCTAQATVEDVLEGSGTSYRGVDTVGAPELGDHRVQQAPTGDYWAQRVL